ncbi:U11/U12 small nuclear ribonucleoprotein 48 kDa protein-like [Antedon mediterranea]|uniref:U11/U12 small nuclear ribonucleoprotein 48 kDa protein-like n=1 Tax=Antedon mediterranea TaxID=105859 RepID=UPI003AF97AE0
MEFQQTDDNERQTIISDLSEFIGEHEAKLDNLMVKLNWTHDKTMDCKPLVQCPVNNDHFVSEETLESHSKQCQLSQHGYTLEEQEQMSSLDWLYSKMKNVVSVKLDEKLQSDILLQGTGVYSQKPVALTAEREVTNLTPHERALIHDHVVKVAKKVRSDNVISVDLTSDPLLQLKEEKKEPTTYLELLAAQRDYKRRRQTYKGKSKGVTSNKKSQTEILREVIDSQMEDLFELNTRNKIEENNDGEQDRRKASTERISSKHSSREGSQSSSRISNESSPQRNASPHRTKPQKDRRRHRSRSRSRDRHDLDRKHKKHKHKERR